jgi:hypothetical protein
MGLFTILSYSDVGFWLPDFLSQICDSVLNAMQLMFEIAQKRPAVPRSAVHQESIESGESLIAPVQSTLRDGERVAGLCALRKWAGSEGNSDFSPMLSVFPIHGSSDDSSIASSSDASF